MVDGTELLGTYLKKAGLTQEAFAAKAGVPGPQVSLWLSGRRRPGVTSAVKIERATGGQVPVEAWSTERSIPSPRRARKVKPAAA